jgi:hypothetical protein
MRDSVEFLRSKAEEYAGEYNPEPSKIFKAAAKEIARLRRRLAEVRLTDAEREAIETSFDALQYAADELGLGQGDCDRLLTTLRGLLERTNPASTPQVPRK